MTFNPLIPSTGMSLGQSRPLVQGNFNVLNTKWQINHLGFNVTGAGKHKMVEMPVLGSIPSGLAANEITLYSKIVPLNNQEALFMTKGTSTQEIQMSTGDHSGANQLPKNANPGGTFLPGGLMMVWAYVNSPVVGGNAITYYAGGFSIAGTPTPAYSINVQPDSSGASPSAGYPQFEVNSPTATGFDLFNGSPAGTNYWYVAIGPKT